MNGTTSTPHRSPTTRSVLSVRACSNCNTTGTSRVKTFSKWETSQPGVLKVVPRMTKSSSNGWRYASLIRRVGVRHLQLRRRTQHWYKPESLGRTLSVLMSALKWIRIELLMFAGSTFLCLDYCSRYRLSCCDVAATLK